MILNLSVDDNELTVDVPKIVLNEGEEFFLHMDRDMDRGWQMGRQYIENPTVIQRCQIAADRLLTALHQSNEDTTLLMAGYIMSRLPAVDRVIIDHTGNMQNTEFELHP